METAEQILDKYLKDYPWQHWSKENAIKAMEEHRSTGMQDAGEVFLKKINSWIDYSQIQKDKWDADFERPEPNYSLNTLGINTLLDVVKAFKEYFPTPQVKGVAAEGLGNQNTAMQELIDMMNESVNQYSDNGQQEAIFFALIEEAKKQLPKEKQQIIDAWIAGYSECENYQQDRQSNSEGYYDKTFTTL